MNKTSLVVLSGQFFTESRDTLALQWWSRLMTDAVVAWPRVCFADQDPARFDLAQSQQTIRRSSAAKHVSRNPVSQVVTERNGVLDSRKHKTHTWLAAWRYCAFCRSAINLCRRASCETFHAGQWLHTSSMSSFQDHVRIRTQCCLNALNREVVDRVRETIRRAGEWAGF